jgi:hypothetical protein
VALKVFTSARAALESVRGTDLTPTRIIYGEDFTHEQTVATIRPTEYRGSYNPVYSASAGPETNTLSISGRMSYTDAIWYGNMFFVALASGTGGGADKTWTFTPAAATDNVKTATVQLGYVDTIATTPAVKLNYCIGQSLNLHWEKNDDGAVTFKADFLSAKAASQITAFTGSLSDRVTVPASSNGTTVYIDTVSAIGSTADTTVIAVDFNLDLGPVPLYTLDGTTAAAAVYRPNHRTWTAEITRQFTNDTYWDDYQDKTTQKVRVRTLGAGLGSSNYKIDLDLYGTITNRTIADVDGIVTEVLSLSQIYDTGAGADHSLVVVNEVASIT